MARSQKNPPSSGKKERAGKPRSRLVRGLRYLLVLLMSGGGAGVGGWQFKDHPVLHRLIQHVTGARPGSAPEARDRLRDVALKLAASHDPFRKPGFYEVTVNEVRLDPTLFKPGRTIDIQVRVQEQDSRGRDTVVWESRSFGERLATVGRDELAAGWPRRPFQVDWAPGVRFRVEVWDRKGGSLLQTRHFEMQPATEDEFPFRPGTHGLSLVEAVPGVHNPDANRIVFQSRRLDDPGVERTSGVADRDDGTVRIK